jgi:5-methylcytosine-specific restriction endonuclease McrA
MYDPTRKQVLRAARIEGTRTNKDGSIGKRPAVYFVCAECEKLVPGTEIQIDHIVPVGKQPTWPPNGDGTWDKYLTSLFCDASNLRAICRPCHKEKSAHEKSTGAYL